MRNLFFRSICVSLFLGLLVNFSAFASESSDDRRIVNVAGVEEYEQWQKDVRLKLSDTDDDCRFLKKIEVFGIPDDYFVREIRIESFTGFGKEVVAFSDETTCSSEGVDRDRQMCSSVSFDSDRKCYEVLFNPSLYYGVRVEKDYLDLAGYFVRVLYKKRGSSDASNNELCLRFEVSNEGLKQPSGFEELKNFAVDYDEQRGSVRVKGIPSGVSSLCLEKLDSKIVRDGSESLRGIIANRDKNDGNFYFKYRAKNSGEQFVSFYFIDDSGFKVSLDCYFNI